MAAAARAVVFHGPDRSLELREVPLPKPRGGQFLVRVSCCTLCGSDLHTFAGRRTAPTPAVLGHEILGRILERGPDASPVDLRGRPIIPGDRVTWTMAVGCGHCPTCQHGLPPKCDRVFKYGHEPWNDDHALSGGLADYCLLTAETGLVVLPDFLPDVVACPVNCATATIAAALRVAGDFRGQVVLVQGAGMLGLTACAMADAAGASDVMCFDPRSDRAQLANRFGATATAFADPCAEWVRDRTAGRGADLVLDVSGCADAMESGMTVLGIGGRYLWVGAALPTRAVAIRPEMVVRRWLTIRGVHNYIPADLVAAVQFLETHSDRYPFAELVSPPFALADAHAAFHAALTGEYARIAVRP